MEHMRTKTNLGQKAVGASAKIQQLTSRTLVEVRDLDAVIETSEVEESTHKFFKDAVCREIKMRLSKSIFRGTRKKIVELEEQSAFELDKCANIKGGWVNCRV